LHTEAIPSVLCLQALQTTPVSVPHLQGVTTMTKRFPRKTLLSLSLAAAVFGLSATAIAQGSATPEATPAAPAATQAADTPRMARMQRQGQRHERMQAQRGERLEQLKTELQLTPEQETAWLAFVARAERPSRPQAGAERTARAELNTPDRLDQMEARHEAMAAAMKQRIDATRSFYASLSDAQKQVFDRQTRSGMMRTGMHGGPRMGQQGQPGGKMQRHGQGMGAGGKPCQPQS